MKQRKYQDFNQLKISFWTMFLSFFALLVLGVLILTVSFYGIDQRENKTIRVDKLLDQYTSEPNTGTYFTLDLEDDDLEIGEQSSFLIRIHTGGKNVDGATVVLQFDSDEIEMYKIGLVSNRVFNHVSNNSQNNLMQITAWPEDLGDTFNGEGIIARVYFTPKDDDDSSISIVCSDSEISSQGWNILNCSQNNSLTIDDINDDNDEDDSGTGGASSGCSVTSRPTNVQAYKGDKAGEIKLTWTKVDGADSYGITYGEKWIDNKGPDEYGATNIGNIDNYIVKGLKNNTLYYFVVFANNSCGSSAYSDGAAAYSGGYTYVSREKGIPVWDGEEDEKDKKKEATVSATPRPTITPMPTLTPSPYPQTQNEGSSFFDYLKSQLNDPLAWVGLLLLAFLAVIFIMALRKKRENDQYEDIPSLVNKDEKTEADFIDNDEIKDNSSF